VCTLIAFWRSVDGHDLVVGMNRDESYSRPANPPEYVEGAPPIVAPHDRTAGGTWIGASGSALVVALSNRGGNRSEGARSRGLLVLDALAKPSVRAVDVFLRKEVSIREYNPWNLFAASRSELRFFVYGSDIETTRGIEGVNVLTNEGGNVIGDPKAEAARAMLPRSPDKLADAVRQLQNALRSHGDPASLCVHGVGRGTVSSTILALNNADPGENLLLYADGAPCSNPYRDYSAAIQRLSSPG
jgi:uncharacterized protein with NRDE domain